MRAIFKKLLIVYLVLVLGKIILNSFVLSPTLFLDEYHYVKMARSFFYYSKFIVNSQASWHFPPLYSILISVSYVFSNVKIAYFFMKVINAILSSAIIFPAYLIASEFLNEEKAFLSSVLVSVLPPIFIFSSYIMSENIFFPLFLLTLYFIYKSFTEANYKWDVLAGISFGLLYLTKIISIFLIPVILIVLIIQLVKDWDKKHIYRKISLFFLSLLVVLPWLIRNGLVFGFSIKGLLGSGYGSGVIAARETATFTFYEMFRWTLSWLALNLTYTTLAVGIIFFIAAFVLFKTDRINLSMFYLIGILTSLSYIIFISIYNGSWYYGAPRGRYLAAIFPILIILGSVGLRKLSKIPFKYIFGTTVVFSALFAYSTKLINYQLFPGNNISLSYIGVLNFILNRFVEDYRFTIMFIIFGLLPFSVLLLYKLKTKKILTIFLIFFLLVNVVGYSLVYYNSYNRWYKQDDMQLGLWFDSQDRFKNVLFDERIIEDREALVEERNEKDRFEYVREKAISSPLYMAFWMNDNIKVGNVNNLKDVNYVITTYDMDLELIKESDSGVYIYKVQQDI